MSNAVRFAFGNLQKVKVKELDREGYVFSRVANSDNQEEYKVRYWIDGNRREEWFYEFELTPYKEGQ